MLAIGGCQLRHNADPGNGLQDETSAAVPVRGPALRRCHKTHLKQDAIQCRDGQGSCYSAEICSRQAEHGSTTSALTAALHSAQSVAIMPPQSLSLTSAINLHAYGRGGGHATNLASDKLRICM